MSEVPAINPVSELESLMRQMPEQLDAEQFTAHHFARGLYCRELFIPAGTTAVGKLHATQNFFLLIQGEMTMATPDGPIRVRAPYMAVTEPGTKRAVFAHEDCICLNLHANPDDERDVALLEDRYITPEALPAPDEKELLT